MAHELVDKLRKKIQEADEAMERGDEKMKNELRDLVQEMNDLMADMENSDDGSKETFKEKVANVMQKVSDKIRGRDTMSNEDIENY